MTENRKDRTINRREFIKQTATAGAASIFIGGGVLALGSRRKKSAAILSIYQPKKYRVAAGSRYPTLAAVRGTDSRQAVVSAITLIGGIETFIAMNDNVVIKPNIGWDRTPELGANTNPDVIAELTRLCLLAGASKVTVIDISCNDPERCYNRSGIKAAAQAEGAGVLIPNDSLFAEVDFGDQSLGRWQVLKPILECDKLINAPVVKHHSLSGMTAGMKNWLGALTGPRNRLHQNIGENIAELARLFQPTLTIVDATRVLYRNGPTGGRLDDVKAFNTIAASTDQVAAEAYATRFLNKDIADFPYIGITEKMGLGKAVLSSAEIAEVEV
jgi:uncharacterized protein (DUF362 family)